MTNLDKVEIEPGYYTKPIEEAFKQYQAIRDKVYGKKTDRPITLMDMACIATKKLKKENKFPVGPALLGFFLFIVVGSAVFQILNMATSQGGNTVY